jgi:hypothetical protein
LTTDPDHRFGGLAYDKESYFCFNGELADKATSTPCYKKDGKGDIVMDGDEPVLEGVANTETDFCLVTAVGTGAWQNCGTQKIEWDTKYCENGSWKYRCGVAGTKALVDAVTVAQETYAATPNATNLTALNTARSAAGEVLSGEFCLTKNPAGAANPSATPAATSPATWEPTKYLIVDRCGGNTFNNTFFCPSDGIKAEYTFAGLMTAWKTAANEGKKFTIGGIELEIPSSADGDDFLTTLHDAIDAAKALGAAPSASSSEQADSVAAERLEGYWWNANDANDLIATAKTAEARTAVIPDVLAVGFGNGSLWTDQAAADAAVTVSITKRGLTKDVGATTGLCAGNGGSTPSGGWNGTTTTTWVCGGLSTVAAAQKTGDTGE